ncbi:MAG: hypothetical protein OEU94_17350 [Aquincola sp.]|nr:hypothetical protein [Aquincola sp.]MDH4289888.1 hypothetical protein [Aquincola sp.]MDH5329451.1 hypothetical protein [Aquincola sp.]
MSAQYLSHVTLETLENYRTAAARSVVAYRTGGRRLVGAVNGALQHSVYPRTAKVAPRATEFMNDVRGNVTQIVIKGLDQTAARAATAIDFGARAAGTQLNKLARFAARVDNPVMADGLQTVARLTMPGAKMALAISGKVAAGAIALADAAGARPVRRAARKAAKGPLTKARRSGRAVKKAVARRARG